MQMMKVAELIPHPRNNEFFDDLTGQRWDEFLESVETSGVIEPIVITEDKVIVSGHQRVRACKALGIEEVAAEIKLYDGDDRKVVKDLIETNVRQRGTIGGSDKQIMARVEALKDWYGVHNGGNDKVARSRQSGSGEDMKIEDILNILGLTRGQYEFSKRIVDSAIPEIQELIEDGTISRRAVVKLIAKLSPEDQRKLIDKLPDDVKLSAKSIEAKINEIRAEGAANANAVQQENDELRGRNDSLVRENNELRSGKIDVSEATQNRINALEEEKRGYYEKWNDMRNENERLRKEMDKAIQAMRLAESKANGGDETAVALENRIAELEIKIQATEREKNDLEFQLSEKDDEIEELKSRKKDGALRSAVTQELSNSEYNERQLTSFKTKVSQSASAFEMACNEILKDINLVSDVEMDTRKALREIIDRATVAAQKLGLAIMPDSLMLTYNMTNGNNNDYDDDYFSEDDLICSGQSA